MSTTATGPTWTQYKMYVLEHIPAKYYVVPDEMPHLPQLYDEIARHGRILLDHDARPVCLSGRRPQLLRYWPDLHGPWRDEP